jgi:hypothetical protein
MWTPCRRKLCIVLAALVAACAAAPARGQERAAPDRVELGAFPGGRIMFPGGQSSDEPAFANYTLGMSLTWNVSPRMGVEGEAAVGFGGSKTVAFAGRTLASQAMPDTISYIADVVFTLGDRRHAIVPYALFGAGAFSVMKREGSDALGVIRSTALLAGNVGGGCKWFTGHGWGVRADYRLFLIQHTDDAPEFFGGLGTRYGHRVYVAAFTTF